jgi:NADPH-dependent 2,4-dienoyl-CoA reductase/sulfur reductase-like enzyme
VLAAVREAAGDGVAVGVRLAGDDEQHHGPGLTAEDAAEVAARYEALGLVDFVNVSVGIGGVGMVRTNYAPHGFGVYAAQAVKQAVHDTPVFTVHRIVTPEEADGIVARGDADAVTLVRALIADPEWVAKARDGHADTIRRCTGINQSCYGNLLQSMPINCVQNPAVGREDDLGLGTLTPAAVSKRVVVVGGGPAGLEAAWVAAARGHRVTLLEQRAELGGAIRWAQRLPGRSEIADLADWRIGECARRGVELRTGAPATAASVLALEPDAVIVATGGHATKDGRSAYHPMPIPGSEQDWVLDHVEALRRAVQDPDSLGSRVVVVDVVGHVQGVGLAELLASLGRDTTLVCPLPVLLACDGETQAAILPRAVQAGVVWRPNTALVGIGDRGVTIVDVLSRRLETVDEVDTVAICTNGVPDDALFHELDGRVAELVRVGDAVAVRPVDRAVYDGHRAARAL